MSELICEQGDPGNICAGACGDCELYFPVVYVYYWPVEGADTSCLVGGNSSQQHQPVAGGNSTGGIPVQARGIEGNKRDGATTVVNADGFTFTSPSVYIAFPTISAADLCGNLGEVHTSTTIGFQPDELSTGVFVSPYASLTYEPFDFRYADCPPPSLTGAQFATVIGLNGVYNPLLSPPAELTSIDPKWNANCYAAAFQGNDPPYAITPQSVLAQPTFAPPAPISTKASPAAAVTTSASETSSPPPPPIPTTTAAPNVPVHPTPSSVIDGPKSTAVETSVVIVSPTPADPTQESDPPQPQSLSSAADPAEATDPAIISIGGQTVTANTDSAFVIGTQTLTPGGQITVSQTVVSLAPSGSYVVVGQPSTIALTAGPSGTVDPQVITIGSQIVTASGSKIAIGSQTLVPGSSAITVDGTPISLAPATGTTSPVLVIGNPQTIAYGPSATAGPQVLTLGGSTYTMDASSVFVVGTQTLAPGAPAITISGTPVSLAATPTDVVIGTSTEALGSIIMGGFGTPGSTQSPSATIAVFEGASENLKAGHRWVIGLIVAGSMIWAGLVG